MQPIATPAPQPPTEEDVFCRCGYNLRGLPRDGRCPECGRPIELAIHDVGTAGVLRDARFIRWSCLCFVVSLFFMQQIWFGRGVWGNPAWTIAATAMAVGAFLFPSPQHQSAWRWSDLVHVVALRALTVVWAILAVLMQPNRLVSFVDVTDLRMPIMLMPVAILYCMNFQLSRWLVRLGDRSLGWACRGMSWLFPLVLMYYATRFSSASYIGLILFEMLPIREVIRWGAPALFFVNAFLLGVTWYASLLATCEAG